MKKNIFYLMTICLLLAIQPLQINASNSVAKSSLVMTNQLDSTEAKVLLLRLNEINEMDKSKLNSSEKKILRKEVSTIKYQLEEQQGRHGGVYLSFGALVIIILLLIILL